MFIVPTKFSNRRYKFLDRDQTTSRPFVVGGIEEWHLVAKSGGTFVCIIPPLGGRPNTKLGDHDTPNAYNY